MTNTGKIVLAAGVLASGLVWWSLTADDVTPVQVPGTSTAVEQKTTAVLGKTVAEPTTERTEVVEATATTADSYTHPYTLRMRCHLVDVHGLPVEGRKVMFGPLQCASNVWSESSDENGLIEVAWPSRVPSQEIAVAVHRQAVVDALQVVQTQSGQVSEVTLLAKPRNRMVMTGEFNLVATGDGGSFRFVTAGGHSSPCNAKVGLHPDALLGDRIPRPAEPDSEGPDLFLSSLPITGMAFSSITVHRTLNSEDEEAEEKPSTVNGTVFHADGTPAKDVLVCWGRTLDHAIARTQTDDQGQFTFEKVPQGAIELRAGGGREGIGRAQTFANPSGVITCSLHLDQGSVIRGTARSSDGSPLAQHRVVYVSHDGNTTDLATTDEDGSYELANVTGPGRLLLLPGKGPAMPIALTDSALPDSTADFTIDAVTLAESGITLRLSAMDARSGNKIRLWQADSRLGVTMPKPDEEGIVRMAGLRPGYYRIELAAPSGWLDMGSHFVDGKNELDLGTIALPAAGTLQFEAPLGAREVELYHRRPFGDIRAEGIDMSSRRIVADAASMNNLVLSYDEGTNLPTDSSTLELVVPDGEPPVAEAAEAEPPKVSLPVGDWLLFFRDGEGPVQVRPFTIRGGLTEHIELPPLPH